MIEDLALIDATDYGGHLQTSEGWELADVAVDHFLKVIHIAIFYKGFFPRCGVHHYTRCC